MDAGTILFQPQGAQAQPGGTTISDGSYRIPAANGLLPGKYSVVISAPSGGGSGQVEMPGESNAGNAMERIPAKYNVDTELTAEVTDGGDNQFNFDLK